MEQQSVRLTSRRPGIRPYSGYTCAPRGSQAGAGTQGYPRASLTLAPGEAELHLPAQGSPFQQEAEVVAGSLVVLEPLAKAVNRSPLSLRSKMPLAGLGSSL